MKELKQLQQDWNDLAEIDPLWAIASVPGKSHGRWNIEEFFKTGQIQILEALAYLQSLGINIRKGTALDFGCGIGRFTQALAEEFEKCYGIDISPKMIELASRFNRFKDHCEYILNLTNDLSIFDRNSFDFIYTVEVLQHLPRELMLNYLEEFVRTLKPDGVLVFQVPERRLERDEKTEYLKSLKKYHPLRVGNKLKGIFIGHDIATRYYRLRRIGFSNKFLYDRFGFRPHIQMNTLSETDIYEQITTLGAKVEGVIEREHPEMLNKLYVVIKLV